jgi:hypothetical protein
MHIIATYANSAHKQFKVLCDHTTELFTATSGVVATDTANINNSSPLWLHSILHMQLIHYGAKPVPVHNC